MLNFNIPKNCFSEIKPGEKVDIDVLIEEKSTGTTKRWTEYFSLKLKDVKEKEIGAKVWDTSIWPDDLKVGSVCRVSGEAGSYQDQLQLVISKVTESTRPRADFATKSPIGVDREALWGELVNIVGTFEEPLAKFLGESLLEDHSIAEQIQTAPAAAKIHNNWIGGLLEHAIALCRLAEAPITQYKKYCPNLSRDKILLGCLVHDLGKIKEFDYSGAKISYTKFGHLLGHIAWGPMWLGKEFQRFNTKRTDGSILAKAREDFLEIVHIVVSHHGKLEYGSPVVPATLEAIIVHSLDMMDTHAMHAIKAMDKEGDLKGFSERSWTYGANYKIIR